MAGKKITDLPKKIMCMIFTMTSTRTMLSCRQVCANWHQLINDENHLMNRVYMQITAESFPNFLESQPVIIPKFVNLKLVCLRFTEPLSEYLEALLPAVQNITFFQCCVNQQHLMTLFQTFFDAINSSKAHQIRSVDEIKLDGFIVLPNTYDGSGEECMQMQHSGFTSPPSLKNLNIKITDIGQIIRFFEQLKDMNVIVLRLNIDFHINWNQENFYAMLNQLLNLFQNHYQHLIKELTIDLQQANMNLDRFYRRLCEMRDLRLEVLRLIENNGFRTDGVFLVFVKNQLTLSTLEFQNEMDQETVNALKSSILPRLKCFKMGVATQINHTYFWHNFPITSNLRILEFNVDTRSQLEVEIDFAKVPALEILEIKNVDIDDAIAIRTQSTVVFVNLNQNIMNLTKLTIHYVGIDDRNFKWIFEYMQNLEELQFKASLLTNVYPILSMTSTSINKLVRLHTLWLDASTVNQRGFLENLQLPRLKKLGFFKSANDDTFYLNISVRTLGNLAINCPWLLEICDDYNGTVYQRSQENRQFCKTRAYQDIFDLEFDELEYQ